MRQGGQADGGGDLSDRRRPFFFAEEREKKRIAERLHDEMGPNLALLRIKLRGLQGDEIFGGHNSEIEKCLLLVEQCIAFTRNLTLELSPPVLHRMGLEAAFEWLAGEFEKKHSFRVSITSRDWSSKEILEEVRIAVFRSAGELLLNAVKHSGTSRAELILFGEGESRRVEIRDAGRGFDPGEAMARRDCYGLFNVKERMISLGGDLLVESSPGGGTRAAILLPKSLLLP